jgi:hypothetical protein
MRTEILTGFLLVVSAAQATANVRAAAPADVVYRHGYVYTVDAQDSVRNALAVRARRIV